ncbi:hypothetical protein OE749_18285 [Aestuariibacter sp. AA17]|uniref:Fibronectin type-III domain-containing protein n=2 Tax=Fluctibacter corallii TaxID=2984329 RepID=A0ABT3ADD0_9ALTE|nr:hypothetical protein [Aestuariibacter sp. AA17]
MFRQWIVLTLLFSVDVAAKQPPTHWMITTTDVLLTDSPTLLSAPVNVQVERQNQANTLVWQGESDAIFVIEETTDGNHYTQVGSTSENTFRVDNAVTGRFSYRVQACDNNGYCSNWSVPTRPVGEIPPITAIAFEDAGALTVMKIAENNPHQYYEDVVHIYEYRNVRDEQWTRIETPSAFTPPTSGEYWLRGYVCRDSEALTECSVPTVSSHATFLAVRPTRPVAKLHQGPYNEITFSWNEQENAAFYHVLVQRVKDVSTLFKGKVVAPQIVFNDQFPRGENIAFEVMACASETVCSIYSEFIITSPFVRLTPYVPTSYLEVGENNYAAFSWEPSARHADYYEVKISDNGMVVFLGKTTDLSIESHDFLSRGNPLAFQVRACLNEGSCSNYSEPKTFTPEWLPHNPLPRPWTLNASKTVAQLGEQIRINWSMHPDFKEAVTFNIKRRSASSEVILAENVNATHFDYIVDDIGELTLFVEACNNIGECGRSRNLSLYGVNTESTLSITAVPDRVMVGEKVGFVYNLPSGYSCYSPFLKEEIKGRGVLTKVILAVTDSNQFTWRCSDFLFNYKFIDTTFTSRKLPAPSLRLEK